MISLHSSTTPTKISSSAAIKSLGTVQSARQSAYRPHALVEVISRKTPYRVVCLRVSWSVVSPGTGSVCSIRNSDVAIDSLGEADWGFAIRVCKYSHVWPGVMVLVRSFWGPRCCRTTFLASTGDRGCRNDEGTNRTGNPDVVPTSRNVCESWVYQCAFSGLTVSASKRFRASPGGER